MDKPNVLFLFSDEHGFRYMNHLSEEEGGEDVHTPNFDQLASEATVFTDTYCQMSLCTPSRMCTFTGREVRKCGAWRNGSVLRPEIPTLPEALEQNGYETCLVGKYHLGGSNQLGGFQHRPYGDLTGCCGHQWEPVKNGNISMSMEERTSEAGITQFPESMLQENIVCEEALSFLRELKYDNPDKPYFLCASFSRPHYPLTAPKRHFENYWPEGVTEPKVEESGDAFDHPMSVGMREGFKTERIDREENMKARAGYMACVSYLDEIIGDFLSRLEREGFLENTIIVYASDHGEMAGEHGMWWKAGWFEACTRVPFIISLPEQRKGEIPSRKIKTPVALTDLFPTLCGLTGTEPVNDLDGIDLSDAILNRGNVPEDRPVFSDFLIPRWGKGTEFRMIRWKNYKYVAFRNAPDLMFNLDNDPEEQENIINSEKEEIIELRKKLERIAEQTMDFEEAERERKERDGDLKQKYPLDVSVEYDNNLFIMPDGKVVTADDILYQPRVVASNYREIFLTEEDGD